MDIIMDIIFMGTIIMAITTIFIICITDLIITCIIRMLYSLLGIMAIMACTTTGIMAITERTIMGIMGTTECIIMAIMERITTERITMGITAITIHITEMQMQLMYQHLLGQRIQATTKDQKLKMESEALQGFRFHFFYSHKFERIDS